MAEGASPFTQAAVSALRKLYPEELADKSFDNTGLLLEAPADASKRSSAENSVLLTIDLTTAVADEAINKKVSLVVAYHPIIFRALKSLTLANTQQRSLLRLAAAGISVYSPHTAVDAAAGGNADWLAGLITGRPPRAPQAPRPNPAPAPQHFAIGSGARQYAFQLFPRTGAAERPAPLPANVSAVTPVQRSTPSPPGGVDGMGRLVEFAQPAPLADVLANLALGLGVPAAFSLALPHPGRGPAIADVRVRTVGVCAGSGGGVLGQAAEAPDLVVTGEMGHHEALAYAETGTAVVTVGHSNSERGYLRQGMQPLLAEALRAEMGEGAEFTVLVSDVDVDPFGSVTLVN